VSALTEAFGERLIAARFDYGLISQEHLALRAGVHRTQSSMYETGRRMPKLETFVRLAGGLEMSADELLGPIRWVPAGLGRPGRLVLGEEER
jgi:transcriptional regulator with XRE-family HTH domain